MIHIDTTSRGLTFTVQVLPRSAKVNIVGSHQGALKIKLTAPPVGGAANKQCIQVLAKALGLPKSALSIVRGETSRIKQVCVLTHALESKTGAIEAWRKKIWALGSKST